MSGVVATASNRGEAPASRAGRSRSTSRRGTSSPSPATRSRGSPSPSTTRTSASRSRVASPSGPKRTESGTAIAPTFAAAMCATAVSGRCGRTIPMRSPNPTPSPRSAFASRFDSSASSPNVTVRVIARPSVTRIAGASRGCRSLTSTPRLSVSGRSQRKDDRSSSYSARLTALGCGRRPRVARASRGRSVPSGRARRRRSTRRPRGPPPRAGRGRRSGCRRPPGRSPRRRRP